MKGLIFVLLMLGLLLISSPKTHGQPVPDGGTMSDQKAEDHDMSIIVFLSALDSTPEESTSGTSSTEDDGVVGAASVTDSAIEESSTQEDDGVSAARIVTCWMRMCPK